MGTEAVKVPLALAVAEESVAPASAKWTVSPPEKPDPDTLMELPGATHGPPVVVRKGAPERFETTKLVRAALGAD
jgi:hypothetical protein